MISDQNQNPASNYDTDTAAGEWDSPERTRRLVEQYIAAGSLVLDLGIGTGQAVKGYSDKGAVIIGVDHDQDMLDVAKAVVGESADMRLGDINSPLPVDDLLGKVDVVQAIGVLEFAAEIESVIKQVNKALKPGGVFVFTIEEVPHDQPRVERVSHFPESGVTVYRRRAEDIQALLLYSGFQIVSDESYGGYIRESKSSDKVPYHIFLAQKPVQQ